MSEPTPLEPTPLTARLRRAHRKCVNCDRLANTVPDWEHCHGHKVALAYSDCPIASLLAEIEGYRQALEEDICDVHRATPSSGICSNMGTLAACSRARRVLAGKEAQGA